MISSKDRIHHIVVDGDHVGRRLDSFIASQFPEISRTRASRLIRKGFVHLDGEIAKSSAIVSEGDRVTVEIPPPVKPSAKPQSIDLDVIFEDEDIIVVDKPAGMVVHPAAGHPDGTLVNALLAHCGDLSGIGGELKAGIVHRLDIGTSGAIVAAKNDAAHRSLADQFKARGVTKVYRALVYGAMRTDSGRFDAPLGRSLGHRKRFSSHTKKARVALTEWNVIERFGKYFTWLEILLRTGRTHQIRVHFAESGHPLVGDPLYGGRRKIVRLPQGAAREAIAGIGHPILHALRLGFEHPRSGERVEFDAPIPRDIEALLNDLRRITKHPYCRE